jgi:putative DNA primase/helicase
MSIPVVTTIEPDGTLRYDCGQDIAIRVKLHQRNGTKRCPVELLYQNMAVLATDSNLRDLRDIESLFKHATTRQGGVDWHAVLTAVAKELPEKAQAPWTPVSVPLSAYSVERKEYLWYPGIPKGEPTSLEGDPGVGKSAFLVKLMCHLTTGTPFPTVCLDHPQHPFPPQIVVLFTHEDDPRSTIHPRVLINGGDPDRVYFQEGKRDSETKKILPMTLQDLPILEALLTMHRPALMAFDPMQSFLGPHVDMNQASGTRPILDAVRDLCKAHGCTPLFIRHTGKTQRTKAIHAGLGSIDITGVMRSVLSLYKDPELEGRRILAHTKSNGRYAPSMQLKLVGATHDVWLNTRTVLTLEDVRVDWDGLSDLTADDLNARECAHGNDSAEAQGALDEAREFLREMLRDGPVRVDELRTQAKQAGVTYATLRRAKDKEKVKASRQEQDGVPSAKWPWVWELPSA